MTNKYSVPVEQNNTNKNYKIFEFKNDSSMFLIATSYSKNYAIMISDLLNGNSVNKEHLDEDFNTDTVIDYTVLGINRYYAGSHSCTTLFQVLEHNRNESHPTLIANSRYLIYARLISEQLKNNICNHEN